MTKLHCSTNTATWLGLTNGTQVNWEEESTSDLKFHPKFKKLVLRRHSTHYLIQKKTKGFDSLNPSFYCLTG